jgi:hypothetical protein
MNGTDDFLAAVAAMVDHYRPTDLYCGAAAAAIDELSHNWRDWAASPPNAPTVACLQEMTLADIARTIDALEILRRSIAGIRT